MTTTGDDDQDGPASLESEYDEGLALSDAEIGSSPHANHENGHLESESGRLDTRPFSNVHKSPIKFKSPQRQVFIPGIEIKLQITNFERSATTHIINPNLYTIEVQHGEFHWTLLKRYKHIQHLHQQLTLYRTSLNLPFPTKTHKERRTSFKNEISRSKGKPSRSHLPRFPLRPDALVPIEKVDHRMKQLEEYLQNLLKINLYKNHHETANFFEVSELSFIGDFGGKGKEGQVLKRTRSAQPGSTGCNCCGLLDTRLCVRCNYICSDICGSWRTRWLIVKENFIAYVRPKDGRVKAVILFDSGFEVSSGMLSTGYRSGLHIVSLSRQIVLKCPTRRNTQEWLCFIKDMLCKEGRDFTQRNRYFSFTPVRPLVLASWFVDGAGYMSAVADALEQATEEIFIADWWLSPEIYMKRPALSDKWRLDKILHRKASEGVKIFVLLYKEVELALGINSFYSKQTIVGNHSGNIKVLRHPDHARAGVFFWAHHEKMVVIDQSIAFLGGIDLCYGRWDDYKHRLTDVGLSPEELSSLEASNKIDAPLSAMTEISLFDDNCGDFCEDVMLQPSPENIKCNTPEMERRSILATMKSRGREWITMLSLTSNDDPNEEKPDVNEEMKNKENEAALSTLTEEVGLDNDGSVDEVDKGKPDTPQPPQAPELSGSTKLWLGKDYTNFILKDFNNLDQPFQDLVDRNTTPRMPWHDIGAMVQGPAARDLARHFIQRWNATKLEKAKLNPQYPYLLPKGYKDFKKEFNLPDLNQIRVSCQVVRSVSQWSAGFLEAETWEGSIHEAYVDAIAKARHYIYIENQFFISSLSQVRNQVSDAIFKRVLRAHKEGSVFRVFVVMPLLPGFEGEVGTPSGTALHAITHWNYASISRGEESLVARLMKAGIMDVSEYVTFHGLRAHSVLNDLPITELIYVHSKLLIADDRLVICGSANINDRSLLGKRDSEIAVVIEDEEYNPGMMNGESFFSGKYCGSLRKFLFREHLGLVNCHHKHAEVLDPVISSFYHDVWRKTAQNNTEIFEEVFHCIPSDEAKSFQSMKKYIQEPPLSVSDPEAAKEKLCNVQGHLVMLPLEFLNEETLTPNPSSVQGMLPTSLWT